MSNPVEEHIEKKSKEALVMKKKVLPLKKKVIPSGSPVPKFKKVLPKKKIVGGAGKSLYSYVIPEDTVVTKEQQEIMDKTTTIESLTQDELRKVYYLIGPAMGKRLYGASTVNDIDRKGKHPEDSVPEQSDSLFIGTQVHIAMEEKGKNIGNLKSWDMFGIPPEKPNVNISPDHWKMLEYMEKHDVSSTVAYYATKENMTTKAVNIEEYHKWLVDPTSVSDEAEKACSKLEAAADKENDKFIDVKDIVIQYYRKLRRHQEAKDQYRNKEGVIIVDDLPFRKMNPRWVIEKINRCYQALSRDKDVMALYNTFYDDDRAKDVKSYTEFVILWNFEYKPGKKVPMKSMIDRLHFDFKRKIACDIDIKTHSKRSMAFSTGNYVDYQYYRSTAVYDSAIKYYLKSIGENPEEWDIISILMPVSTVSYEVGGGFDPYCSVSPEDIKMGTTGSFRKPYGTTIFDEQTGYLRYALTKDEFEAWKKLGVVHERVYDLYVKGWQEIIKDYEEKSLPPNIK